MMVLQVGYCIPIYVVVLLCITHLECIPINTFSQEESVTSQTQPTATTDGLLEEDGNLDNPHRHISLGREAVDRIDREMKRRLGISPLTNIRSHHHGRTYISDYIQNLYEQMLQMYDFNLSKRTSAVTERMEKIAIPSVHICRPVAGYEENYHFYLNLSRHADSNITSSQLILSNVTSTTYVTVTFTAAGNHTGKRLELRPNGTGATAVADISNIILNLENISLQIHSATHASFNPVIALFINIDAQDLATYSQRSKRQASTFYERLNRHGTNVNRSEVTVETAESSNICRVKPWMLNFSDIGWGEMIIRPLSYRADMCVGICPSVFMEDYLNVTNHAYLKNLYHVLTDFRHRNEVPVACCSPTLYASRTFIYNENSEIVVKALPEMRVVACGCR